MSATTAKRRLAPEERRQRLLAAAATVFARHGYEGARVEHIAEVAGVSPGLLYRHFDSKRELYEQLIRRGAEELVSRTAQAATPDHEGVERLERGFGAFFSFVEEHRDLWGMMARDEPEPSVAAIREAMYEQTVDAVAYLLALDPEASKQRIGELDLKLVAVVIVGAARLLASWWTEHDDVPRSELVAALMNSLWLGLDRLRTGERYE